MYTWITHTSDEILEQIFITFFYKKVALYESSGAFSNYEYHN